MNDLKPYRPRRQSPWPRRMAIALAVAIARGESLGYAETDDSWRKALAALKEMKL